MGMGAGAEFSAAVFDSTDWHGILCSLFRSLIATGWRSGVWFNSEATFRPNNVASTEIIDRKTPNSEVCMANGYSSMVFDQRIFVSFNPCDYAFRSACRTRCSSMRVCTVLK